MDIKTILSKVDHTLLLPGSSWAQIKELLDDGMKYSVASCCIPPHYVKQAVEYVGGKLPICTVIGFPNGYNLREVKVFETERALADGAEEIDMVINIAMVKNANYDYVEEEIKAIKAVCEEKILKVIVETVLLSEEEKVKLCNVVSSSGADYIKTSTGFASGGATFADVELFKKHVEAHVKIKAAGGISSLEDAEKFIELGAERLGTSKIVKILKNGEAGQGY